MRTFARRLLACALLLVLAGCSTGRHAVFGEPPSTPSSQPAPAPSAVDCDYLPSDGRESVKVDRPTYDPAVDGRTMIAELKTNRGTITIELDGAKAPCTVASFRHLAGLKYFDGTPCHRLTTVGLHVLQCGDPSGTGMGGPTYKFADENLPHGAVPPYPRGTVAMANAGPDTNGSQFFINYKDNRIDPYYAVIGRVTSGLDVVDKVANAGAEAGNGAGDGAPKLSITIESFTVRPA